MSRSGRKMRAENQKSAQLTEIPVYKEILEEHTVAHNELVAWADDAQVVVEDSLRQIKPIKQAE